MNIAEQIKYHFPAIEQYAALKLDGGVRGYTTEDYDNETTEYDFPDGSVLIVPTYGALACKGDQIRAYGSR